MGEIIGMVADANAESQATMGEHVDKSDRLRQMHGIVERRHEDVGADADATGARGDGGEQRQRTREHAFGARVTLGHEDPVEAVALGLLGLDQQLIGEAGAAFGGGFGLLIRAAMSIGHVAKGEHRVHLARAN